uniref:C2H2-type domain-containing protein n=1 Tax=Anopheles christyi TaxID=43041 RepID=A0A182JT02_9DIPT
MTSLMLYNIHLGQNLSPFISLQAAASMQPTFTTSSPVFVGRSDKPHVCEVCKKSFALACNLKAHMKTHEENASQESEEIDVDSDLRSDGEEIGPLFSYEKPDERGPRYHWRHSKAEPITRSR